MSFGSYILQFFLLTIVCRGLVGPTRQFGKGSIYHPHLYAIIAGVFLPIPFYLWKRRYPNSWARYVSTPVVFAGLAAIPPATGINYSSWFLVAFIFQYLVRKKNFAWWSKFNYVLSSALDSGTVIAIMLIFFALQVGCRFVVSDRFLMFFFENSSRKVGFDSIGGVIRSRKTVSFFKPLVLDTMKLIDMLAADWKRTPLLSIPPNGIPWN